MILSDREIWAAVNTGRLHISPFEHDNLQPASYDITIGDTYSSIAGNAYARREGKNYEIINSSLKTFNVIVPGEEVEYTSIQTSKFLLLPGQFVLANTQEYIKLDDKTTAFVEGRSSWGRLGLFIQSAGWVDPGFEGQITLQLFNASRFAIELRTGLRIGQLVFSKMNEPCCFPYQGKYQRQTGATGSKINLDFKKVSVEDVNE